MNMWRGMLDRSAEEWTLAGYSLRKRRVQTGPQYIMRTNAKQGAVLPSIAGKILAGLRTASWGNAPSLVSRRNHPEIA